MKKDFLHTKLVQHYAIVDFVSGSPREVLRASFQAHLIDDDIWMEMLETRNLLAHDYDGTIITESCKQIRDVYLDALQKFEDTVEQIID